MAASGACELCAHPASIFCPADCASLCSKCDSEVHGANLIVQRHLRFLVCSSCASPTSLNVTSPLTPESGSTVLCTFCAAAATSLHCHWSQPAVALGVPLPVQIQRGLNPKFMAPHISPESEITGSTAPLQDASLPACVPVSPSLRPRRPESASQATSHVPCAQQTVVPSRKRSAKANLWAWEEANLASRKMARVCESGAVPAVIPLVRTPGLDSGHTDKGVVKPPPPQAPAVAHVDGSSRRTGPLKQRTGDEAASLMVENVRDECAEQALLQGGGPCLPSATPIQRDGPGAAAQGKATAAGGTDKVKGHVLGPKAARRVREVLASWHHDLFLEGPMVCDLAFHMFQKALKPLRSQQVSLDGLRAMLAACLWVATKLDEKQKNMPRASEVAEVARLEAKRVASEEFRVMSLLNWKPLDGFDGYKADEVLA